MVFPSIPIYADPSNWNQQQQPHGLHTSNVNSSAGRSDYDAIQLPPIALPPANSAPILPAPDPTSLTADRSRPTRFPHPESGLNCPRCNSTNTKFCYFNNYSLSQPRHFCRSCRRYWTRGGTLRNVPVGGGSRRNGKRQKQPSSSATTVTSHTGKNQQLNSIMNINRSVISTSLGMKLGNSNMGLGLSGIPMQFQPIPFAATFESSHVLPVQLGACSYSQALGLGSRNEELLGVIRNTTGSDLGIHGGGSQASHSLPNFDSSSHGNVIQQRSLFN